MAIKSAGYNGEPGPFKKLRRSNPNKVHVQIHFYQTINSNDNFVDDDGCGMV
jgi:hypothetical protein